jgi:hypothetical protein
MLKGRIHQPLPRNVRPGRHLVVKWEPVGLEQYFEPASNYDWRPKPEYK